MREKFLEDGLVEQLNAVHRQPFRLSLADIDSFISNWTAPDTAFILKLTSRAWENVVLSNSSTHVGIWNR